MHWLWHTDSDLTMCVCVCMCAMKTNACGPVGFMGDGINTACHSLPSRLPLPWQQTPWCSRVTMVTQLQREEEREGEGKGEGVNKCLGNTVIRDTTH